MTTSAFISRNEEIMPTVEIGDTVTGSQLAAISAEALRNVGWKALRTTHCECDYTEAGIIEAPLGEPPDAPEASPTIVLRPSPNVQALVLVIRYQCYGPQDETIMIAELKPFGSADVMDALQWSLLRGTLKALRYNDRDYAGGKRYDEVITTTGFKTRGGPAAVGVYDEDIRPLMLDRWDRSNPHIVLSFSCSYVRILGVDVIELYQESVEL